MRVNRPSRRLLLREPALVGAFERAKERDGDVHLLGLVSQGGVHSHIDHLRHCSSSRQRRDGERTWIHAFTDGRDVSPHAAVDDLRPLPPARIATVVGRYYAMDRDNRASAPIARSRAIVDGVGEADDPVAAVARATRAASPTSSSSRRAPGRPAARPASDAAIFFNFRPDRGRQLSRGCSTAASTSRR
jgi:2,3-bisphosphoglycerate-independent phosphoglycerate mutase